MFRKLRVRRPLSTHLCRGFEQCAVSSSRLRGRLSSVQRFRAPVLQRAQRLIGNRASQQIVLRAHTVQRQCTCAEAPAPSARKKSSNDKSNT